MLLEIHYDKCKLVWMKKTYTKQEIRRIKKFILKMNENIKYDEQEEVFICEKKDADVIYYLLDNGFFEKLK